jgi:hypothetical protein
MRLPPPPSAQLWLLVQLLASASLACNPGGFDELTKGDASSGLAAGSDASLMIAPDAASPPSDTAAGHLPEAGAGSSWPDAAGGEPGPAAPQDGAVDGSGEPPLDAGPARDPCGQLLPASPSASGIRDGGVTHLPAIAQHPSVAPRPPGVTAQLAGRLLWVFGGTSYADGSTTIWSPSSYTMSDRERPLELDEARIGASFASDFIPALPEDSAGLGAQESLAYAIGSLISISAQEALLFYSAAKASGLASTQLGTRVARVEMAGSAARAEPLAPLLFAPDAPPFRDGLLAPDGSLYLYACPRREDSYFDCRVARAPLASATASSGYQYWTSDGWSSDVAKAVVVLSDAAGQITVSYNPYLRRYLSVHFVWILSQIALDVAQRPEGPWTRFAELEVPANSVGGLHFMVAAIEHPELAKECGRKLLISYQRPVSEERNELRAIEVELE